MNEELNNYIFTLIEDTQLMMDEYQTPEMAFTAAVLDKIEELLDCREIVKEHCLLTKSNGSIIGEIHAYSESINGEVLYLFYTDYNSKCEVTTKSNSQSQSSINRLQGFYNAAIRGAHFDLDENSAEYRGSWLIYDNMKNYQSINLVVLSNYVINNLSIKDFRIAGKSVYCDVWDLKKIYANTHSMSDHIAIDIDFDSEEYSRYKIPFIQMESTQYGYKCIQAMFPAKLLYQLYDRYNTRLLYNNVRYFLGLKPGNKKPTPNVAMLETLRKSNEMFLAYNNGITALAKNVDSDLISDKTNVSDPDSTTSSQYISMGMLKKIFDFRIINGGQTTAVIYNARNLGKATKDESKKVNLLGVYVQVKLIISDEIEKISGNITKSSNFQNSVKYSDFSVGNEFNTKMEELSRTIIAPNANNQPTYWFYERLRGQYDEQRKTKTNNIDIGYFDYQFPKSKKFSKEDVAKLWCNWEQNPHDAVKGASTTYATFMKGMVDRNFIPDEIFYKKSVALLIIYKFLMSRPENKNYGNGKATVVAYAMAMLANLTFTRFDLLKVWNNQGLSSETMSFLNSLCNKLYEIFNNKYLETNKTILSYGKTKAAFDFIKSQPLGLNIHLLDNDLINND